MEQNFTFYESSEERKQEVWSSPGDGLLAGIIEKNISKEQIMLTDFHGATWSIDISVALFRGKLIPAEGLKVKLIGRQTGNQQFKAVEVRLWDGQDKRNRILR